MASLDDFDVNALYHIETLFCRNPATLGWLFAHLLPSRSEPCRYLRTRARFVIGKLSAKDASDLASSASSAFIPKYAHIMSMLDYREQRFDKALGRITAVVADENSLMYRREYLVSAGLYALKGANPRTALAWLRAAYTMFQSNPATQRSQRRVWHYLNYFMWQAMYEEGKTSDGIAFLRVALKTAARGAKADCLFELGQACFGVGLYSEAMTCFRAVLRYPGDRDLHADWLRQATVRFEFTQDNER